MLLIVKNEIEFFNFLKDDCKTGAFNLKLKKLQNDKKASKKKNKEDDKRKVLIYKKEKKPGTVVLYTKKNHKELGVYLKESNTFITEDVSRFVSFRIKMKNKGELFESTLTRSPQVSENRVDTKVHNELEEDKNISPFPERVNPIQNILNTDLKGSKKVWAIKIDGEEVQVDNYIFNKDDSFYIGNSKTNVELTDIKAIKFRGKIYS